MKTDDYEAFLDDAAHAVADQWRSRNGSELGTGDLEALNDLINEFFQAR